MGSINLDAATVCDRFSDHYDRLITDKSVKLIKEFHERPQIKDNFEISHMKLPKLGSLSHLKPMIDENKVSETKKNPDSRLNAEAGRDTKTVATFKAVTKFNEFQREIYGLLKSYKDLLYTKVESLSDIQTVYAVHALDHLANTRARIIKNNKVFEKNTLSEKILQDDSSLRDQGFTRPKILFLLPLRSSALRLGKRIVEILGEEYNVSHWDRFVQEFGDEEGGDGSLEDDTVIDGSKPRDFYQLFCGNTDDAFRIGLKFTKKSIRFFADFYDSDIIIASPLGLKTIISPDEQQVVKIDSENIEVGDRDFLSSLELVILDQADVFLMQNWQHVLDVMQHINIMPSKPRQMDIARVRQWHLEDWSRHYRQLLMFTAISVPSIHSFFQSHSMNYEGFHTLKHRVLSAVANQITSTCQSRFLYYNSPNARDACDKRFMFFTRQVLPYYLGQDKKLGRNGVETSPNKEPLFHTLIFVSSYFDYVRLRNYFRREKLSFTQICEYTEDNKVAKARQLFYFGARQFLLYSERCHFYHRYKIKGVRNIIFYEPPMFPLFYAEMINMMKPEHQGKKFNEDTEKFTTTCLFSNHDTLQLGALVGHTNAVNLIQNERSVI